MSDVLFDEGMWKLVRESAPLPDGRTKSIVRGYHPDVVHVLAFHGEQVVLLREYRAFDGDWIWMLPSGKVDKETDIFLAAGRELREEAGFRAEKLKHYCSAKHSESLASTNHFFLAHDLQPDPLPQDDDELIEVHLVSLDEAIEKVLSSSKIRMPSAFFLLKYKRDSSLTK